MLIAESNLTRLAERWGIWPDVSFGYSQITIATAKNYGIGDGTYNTALEVREALFNGETSIRIGAQHLSYAIAHAKSHDPSLYGEYLTLMGLIVYNSGDYQPEGNWYWTGKYRANIERYRASIAEAKIRLGEM